MQADIQARQLFPPSDSNYGAEFIRRVSDFEFKLLFEGADESQQNEVIYNMALKYYVFLALELEANFGQTLSNLQQFMSSLPADTLFFVFHTLLGLTIKESWVGASFLYVSPEKKLKQEDQLKKQCIKCKKHKLFNFNAVVDAFKLREILALRDLEQLNLYNYQLVKLKEFIFAASEKTISFLEADGETFNPLLPYANLLILAKETISHLHQKYPESPYFSLWHGRTLYIQNEFLENPAATLQSKVQSSYEFALQKFTAGQHKLQKQELALLYVEYSKVSLFYFKYSVSESSLELAQKLLKIRFDFEGKLGVRSKFQSFKTPQLVVEVSNQEAEDGDKLLEEEKKEAPNVYSLLHHEQPKNILLDEECILYEKPKLDDEPEKVQVKSLKTELNIYEQIVALGLMRHLDLTSPHDEVYQEQIQAYCNLLIDKSLSWLVTSNALFRRSLNEFSGFKKAERSIVQLQNLIDQFNDQKPGMPERTRHFFALNYPYSIQMQKQVAEKYMKIGLVMSGCEIFERLRMYEDCIECMIFAGFRAEAENLCKKREQDRLTPKLLCIKGDLTSDISYYKQAWKLSNKKFARAQRSLGRVYYNQSKLEKSIKAFQKAIKINSYQVEQWFIQGFCYIRLQNYESAIKCFSQVVSIDETYSEAWSNIATAFQQLGKKIEAYSTLEQALKHNENNWKIWFNFLHVSLANKKFFSYIESIHKLILLQHKELIEESVLKHLNQIFLYQIELYPKVPHKGAFETIKNRIENVYKVMLEKMGEKAFVWSFYSDYLNLVIEYSILSTQHKVTRLKKQQLESQSAQSENNSETKKVSFQVQPPQQETEDTLNLKLKESQILMLNKIADMRLKSCQVLMKIGWEKDKSICEQLLEYMERLIEAYQSIKRPESDITELKMMIKTLTPILAEQLGKNVELKFE